MSPEKKHSLISRLEVYAKMESMMEVRKGTTTLGIVCKDGILLAADRRVTAGYLIAHKKTKKVFPVSDHMAITTAGLVSDIQLFTKIIPKVLKPDSNLSVLSFSIIFMTTLTTRRIYAPHNTAILL